MEKKINYKKYGFIKEKDDCYGCYYYKGLRVIVDRKKEGYYFRTICKQLVNIDRNVKIFYKNLNEEIQKINKYEDGSTKYSNFTENDLADYAKKLDSVIAKSEEINTETERLKKEVPVYIYSFGDAHFVECWIYNWINDTFQHQFKKVPDFNAECEYIKKAGFKVVEKVLTVKQYNIFTK